MRARPLLLAAALLAAGTAAASAQTAEPFYRSRGDHPPGLRHAARNRRDGARGARQPARGI